MGTLKNGSGEPPEVTDIPKEETKLTLTQIVLLVSDIYSIHDQVRNGRN